MLKGYYVHVHLDFFTPEQSLRSVIKRLSFLNLTPIESVLIRESKPGIPLLAIPTSLDDTRENTREIEQMKPQRGWIECCCKLIKEPIVEQGIVVQLTTEQYRDLFLEFRSSRPLYVKGRINELEPILCQEKRYSLFEGANPFSFRTLTIKRKYDPLVLTAGVFSLMTWISETFESLDPTILTEQRSRVYFWVGESRIGKTVLSQTLVKDYEYSRGGVNWQEYQGSSLQVYDDLNFSEETLAQNLKTLFNTSDEGSIRRVYGISRIKRSAVLVLLNADTFISLKDQIATSHLQDWIEKNSILYPFENDWDPDSDTISDSQLVYGKGTPSRFGEGIVLDRQESETPPFLSLDPLFESIQRLFLAIRAEPDQVKKLAFNEKVKLLWNQYGKGPFPTPQESPVQAPAQSPVQVPVQEDESSEEQSRKRMKRRKLKKRRIPLESVSESEEEEDSFID